MAYAAIDLLGALLLAAGAVPLLDGMPLFAFPATTGEALACVSIGIGLFLFGAFMMIQEVLRQTRRDPDQD